jgi:hypothetical protein
MIQAQSPQERLADKIRFHGGCDHSRIVKAVWRPISQRKLTQNFPSRLDRVSMRDRFLRLFPRAQRESRGRPGTPLNEKKGRRLTAWINRIGLRTTNPIVHKTRA